MSVLLLILQALVARTPQERLSIVRDGGESRRASSESASKKVAQALVAESVDALDLKSNRGSPSVPVQVWPRAF